MVHFLILFFSRLHGILHLGLRVNLILILFLEIFLVFRLHHILLLLLLILLMLVLIVFGLSRGRRYEVVDKLFLSLLRRHLKLLIEFFLLLLELLLVVLVRDKCFLVSNTFHALHLLTHFLFKVVFVQKSVAELL